MPLLKETISLALSVVPKKSLMAIILFVGQITKNLDTLFQTSSHYASRVTIFVLGREDEFREEFQRAVALRTDKSRVDKRMQKALSIKHNYKPRNPYLRY